MASDPEDFYEMARDVAARFGITPPPWSQLSWDDRVEWEDRFNEQILRDKEHPDSH